MARKVATRTCIACGASGDKRGFVRVVRTPAGEVVCDASGRLAGRGAYVCARPACFEQARKRRMFDARLRCKLAAADYERLEEGFRALVVKRAEAWGEGE